MISWLNRKLSSWLMYPECRNLDIDSLETTILRKRIIQEKRFLNRIYRDWYADILRCLPAGIAPVLELGSGAGFLKDEYPDLITSDILPLTHIDLVIDGTELPLKSNSLKGLILINVLHHIPNPVHFLEESARCVKPDGVLVAIEPWVTTWSRWIYATFHEEPIDPDQPLWKFQTSGPLSGSNIALPWIIFDRDRELFNHQFPYWEIKKIQPMMPFVYLLSGGVSLKSLAPAWSYPFFRVIEKGVKSCQNRLAMFAMIVLEKRHTTSLIQPRREDERNS